MQCFHDRRSDRTLLAAIAPSWDSVLLLLRETTQRIERTTPPSARKAAPFVADETGLATNATSAATSSGVAKRCSSEVGRAVVKNSFSTAAGGTCFVLAKSAMNSSTPSERVGPARIELTVTPVPAVVSARPRASATCIVFVTP